MRSPAKNPAKVARSGMAVKAYPVLERAVEEGFAYGWRRAHKHVERPSEEAIRESVLTAIMGEICEWFEFPESDGE